MSAEDAQITAPARVVALAGREMAELKEVLAALVDLKDGPRGKDYERRKPLAWEAARKALGRP